MTLNFQHNHNRSRSQSHSQPPENALLLLSSPPNIILDEHSKKLSKWDIFIAKQEIELKEKHTCLQNLDQEMQFHSKQSATYLYSSYSPSSSLLINSSQHKKQIEFHRMQRRISLRTERLDVAHMNAESIQLQLKMEYQSKLKQLQSGEKSLAHKNELLHKKEKDMNQKQKEMQDEQQKLHENYKEYQFAKLQLQNKTKDVELLAKELIDKKVELDLIEHEYRRKIQALNEEKHKYIELQQSMQCKEERYDILMNENEQKGDSHAMHGERKAMLDKREAQIAYEEKIMNERKKICEQKMQENRMAAEKIEHDFESKSAILRETQAKCEMWEAELHNFENDLQHRNLDLVEQRQQMRGLFDSFCPPK